MRKLMKVLSLLGVSIFILGTIFKFQHWPGGGPLVLLSFVLIFLGFLPTALLSLKKEHKVKLFSKQNIVYLAGFIAFLLTGVALIFVFFHWPGGNYIELINWVFWLFVFFPILFYHIFKLEKNKIVNLSVALFALIFMTQMILWGYAGVTSVSNVFEFKNVENEFSYYKATVKENHTDEASKEIQELNSRLSELEQIILSSQLAMLKDKEDVYSVVKSFIHNRNIGLAYKNESEIDALMSAIDNYRTKALTLCTTNTLLRNFISNKLSTSKVEFKNWGKQSWYKRNINAGNTISFTYTNIQRILKDAYQIHYEILRNRQTKEAPEL